MIRCGQAETPQRLAGIYRPVHYHGRINGGGAWIEISTLKGVVSLARPGSDGQASAVVWKDIVVDGDLSEWPDGLTKYRVRGGPAAYPGSSITDDADLSAWFIVSYDPDRDVINVGVTVRDDVLVVGTDYLGTDACELYLHPGLEAWSGTPPGRYVLVPGDGYYHTIGLNPLGPHWISPVNAAFQRRGVVTSYEFSVPVPTWEGRTDPGEADLEEGTEIGFDVVVVDKDGDEVSAWVPWGPKVVAKGEGHGLDRVGRLRLVAGGSPRR